MLPDLDRKLSCFASHLSAGRPLMPLHPAILAMFARFAATGRPAIAACTVAEARAMLAAGRAALGVGPELHRVEDVTIPTRAGAIPARLFVPKARPDGVVVYLHGGGFVLGGIADFDAVARLIALRSGCTVVLPEYRLAPETPFPGGLEDAVDALLWADGLLTEGGRLPLVVAGDSAGGNLAAVAAAELRGRVRFALQALVYPVTDADFDTPSYLDPANAGFMTRADVIWFFDHYAPADARRRPEVAPLRRDDLAGLPPAYVTTAEFDVLRDEGEAYARRLAEAGIPTNLRRHPGLPHGFIRMHNLVDTADQAVTELAAAIAAAIRADAPAQKEAHS